MGPTGAYAVPFFTSVSMFVVCSIYGVSDHIYISNIACPYFSFPPSLLPLLPSFLPHIPLSYKTRAVSSVSLLIRRPRGSTTP